jgi:S1-C subfamily serine protease
MGVTAEYCRGSSGGPVMDDAGNVIGMVSSTNSIYYPSKDPKKNPRGSFQMVIRNCVPVDAILKLITKP